MRHGRRRENKQKKKNSSNLNTLHLMLLVKHISWHAVFHYWKQICCVIQCYCTFQYRFSKHLVVMQSCCLVNKNQENRVAPSSCYWLDFVEYLPQRKLVTFKQWFETKPSCSAWAFNKLFIKNDSQKWRASGRSSFQFSVQCCCGLLSQDHFTTWD